MVKKLWANGSARGSWMWVKHLHGIFMRSQFFSFVYRRMVPQTTRTGLIQILALIRLSVIHQEEFFQAWWEELIKQLLPCSICRSEYWLLSHLGICDYRLSSYFPSTPSWFPLWKFPKYLVCFLDYYWKSKKNACLKNLCLFGVFRVRSSEFLYSNCNLWQLSQTWWKKLCICTDWGFVTPCTFLNCATVVRKWFISSAFASSNRVNVTKLQNKSL